MSLSKSIGKLHDAIGREGFNEGSVRSQLTVLKEQAEAVEAALKRSELNLKECRSKLKRTRSDLERLQADAQAKESPLDENAVKEIGKQILRILAQPYWPYLPAVAEIAEQLGIQKIEAEYHVDKLVKKDFVKRVRSSIKFTEKGRAYAVESKLV